MSAPLPIAWDGELVRAVLLDCDGVLVDSEVISSEVLAERCAQLGVELTAEQARRDYKGLSLESLQAAVAERAGQPLPPGWLREFIDARLARYRAGVAPIPGALELIAAVRAAGLPLAVVSQGSREKMAVTLPASGIDAALGGAPVFSGDDVTRGKPHPDLYLLAAQRLGAPPAGCVVVEDSPTGARSAQAAGMRVLGYAGDGDPQPLLAAGAHPISTLAAALPLLGLPVRQTD